MTDLISAEIVSTIQHVVRRCVSRIMLIFKGQKSGGDKPKGNKDIQNS